MNRDFRLDNMKIALMSLVVFGHLLEYRLDNPAINYIYVLIYLFHMPAFAFICGCVTRFNGDSVYWRKTITDILIPYFIFNTIYTAAAFISSGKIGVIQYTTPYWLMWFMMALLFWRSATPVFSQLRWPFATAVLIGLLAEFSKDIGYYLSLSRTLAFLPFFVLGYTLGNRNFSPNFSKLFLAITSIVILITASYYLQGMNKQIIYRSGALTSMGLSEVKAIAFYIILTISAFAGISLMQLLPSRNIPYCTHLAVGIIGAYLLHGLIVRFGLPNLLSKSKIPSDWMFFSISLGLTATIVFICSLLAIKLPFLFNFRWLESWFFIDSTRKEIKKNIHK